MHEEMHFLVTFVHLIEMLMSRFSQVSTTRNVDFAYDCFYLPAETCSQFSCSYHFISLLIPIYLHLLMSVCHS